MNPPATQGPASNAPASSNPPPAGRRAWIGLGVITLPCLLYSMDLTVLNLALPRLSAELRPTSSQLLWIVDIYGFLVAGFLTTMGTLGDRIGRRRVLLMGAAAFGVASVLAAFSRSAGMLIAARAVLGIAGATLAPSTLSLIRNMFLDPRERTVAIGVWATSFSVGGALGPVLGGMMLQHFWWGSVFLLAVPVMVVLLALGPSLLPEYRDPAAGRLDLPSAGLSLVAVLAAIYGLKSAAREGLGVAPLLFIAAGLGLGVLFVRRQRRLADPLIDLRLFAVRAFRVSLATFTLTTLIVFGSYVFIGQYLQLVLGLSPLAAGLWLLPGSAGVIIGSMLAPAIVRRIDPAVVMGGGLGLATLGFAILTRVDSGAAGLVPVVCGSALVYLGLGPVFTLGTDLIIGAAPPERAGAAAAISETSSEFGGALGIALLGSMGTAIYRSTMSSAALAGVSGAARDAARETLGGAVDVAQRLSELASTNLLLTARAAFAHALQVTALVCALVAAVTAAAAIVLLRGIRAGGHAQGEPVEADDHAEPALPAAELPAAGGAPRTRLASPAPI
jgi:DHA2 family multidrug resistance protein-like MFS transporter